MSFHYHVIPLPCHSSKFLKDGNMPLADVAKKVIEFSKSHGLEFDSLDKATDFIKGILGQNTESVNFQGFQSIMSALK